MLYRVLGRCMYNQNHKDVNFFLNIYTPREIDVVLMPAHRAKSSVFRAQSNFLIIANSEIDAAIVS